MITVQGKLIASGILAITLFGAGLTAGWLLWRPKTIVQVAAPEIRQQDGSLVAKVKPDPKAKPLMEIPKGAKVLRQGNVIAQPLPSIPSGVTAPTTGSNPLGGVSPSLPSAPLTIDWTLVDQDGQQRMVFKSEDGTILAAVDIPVRDADPAPTPLKNAAGLIYGPLMRGVFYDRDLAFLRLGVEVLQVDHPGIGVKEITGNLKLGLRF